MLRMRMCAPKIMALLVPVHFMFIREIFAASSRKTPLKKILVFETVTKFFETRTPSPLIQCWLQIRLLISGFLTWLLQAWHNIESGGRGDSG